MKRANSTETPKKGFQKLLGLNSANMFLSGSCHIQRVEIVVEHGIFVFF